MTQKREKIALDKGNLVISFMSLLIGGYLGQVIPPLVSDPFNQNYWAAWLLTASCVFALFSLGSFVIISNQIRRRSFQVLKDTENKFTTFEALTKDLVISVEKVISQQVTLVARENAYQEMSKAIQNAEKSVSVVTVLSVDWDSSQRNWEPAMQSTQHRKKFYSALKSAIKSEDVIYERIWQIPPEKINEVERILFEDPLHKEEYDQINSVRTKNPHLARFMIASIITTASFVLIDGKKLFFNIDLYNEITREVESPYMLFIKDYDGNSFEALKGVIARFNPLGSL